MAEATQPKPTASPELLTALNGLLATETSSLANHLEEAQPHLDAKTYPLWDEITHLQHHSAEHAEKLTKLIDSLGSKPKMPSYIQDVAFFHFLTLQSVLPKLIVEKQAQIVAYDAAVGLASSDSTAAQTLTELREDDAAVLVKLQEIQKSL